MQRDVQPVPQRLHRRLVVVVRGEVAREERPESVHGEGVVSRALDDLRLGLPVFFVPIYRYFEYFVYRYVIFSYKASLKRVSAIG